MDSVKVYLNSDSCGRKIVKKIFTAVSQLIIILLVWEFLRSSNESTETTDELLSQLNSRSGNLLDCFQKSSHGEMLDFDSIISSNKTINSLDGKEKQYVLSVDVIVRTSGSDFITVYTAGTPVSVSQAKVDSDNQMWKIDYFEYNDDDVSNNVINNESDDQKPNLLSLLGLVTSNELALKESSQSQPGRNSSKLVYDLNPSIETAGQQGAPPAEHRVIDVMLVEDQMLKVRPRDQHRQQEIVQLLKRRKDVQLLLQSRARQLNGDILRRVRLNSWRVEDQHELKEGQQVTVIRSDNKVHDNGKQNLTKGLTQAWPDVVLDETSEPLYTEGFLERVQRVKSELYSRPMLYNKKLKGKVRKWYLLNNPSLCQGLSAVDVVYLIHSQPDSTEDRQRLRQTILKFDKFKPFRIVYVFLMGRSTSVDFPDKLKLESEQYGDIVQGDFDDTFHKNAWKGLMGMRWVLQFCRKVNFILKINDNVFVDTDKLVRGLVTVSAGIIGKRAMFCALNSGGYNGSDNLTLPFCEGFAVLLTRHLVCSIVASSNQIRVPVVEDYYLYGILPYVIGGVEVYNLSGNHGFKTLDAEALSCYRDQKDKCPILATQSVIGSFSALWTITETREDNYGKWPDLWNLRSVKSYLS